MIHFKPVKEVYRRDSPLSHINSNNPERQLHGSFTKIPVEEPGRMRKINSHMENKHSRHVIDLSQRHRVDSESKPRLSFSTKGNQPKKDVSAVKDNLQGAAKIKAKCGITGSMQHIPVESSKPKDSKQIMKVKDFLKIKELGKGKFGTVWLAM